ncbi:hypothetical protein ACNO8S_19655 (plasmid) [Haloarcula sp. KBTZ06]|uniref:hypothetical protein n=1 Tax=unclassified Haloarcula TaxID=2624677 RepID=UPI00130673D1|nr:hypothetical protein [Haloarcula sp. CBA1122]MUV48582.1 hypothetical protein [Haloarcula sp. CBA1122]
MGFTEKFDAAEPTHRLVSRSLSGVKDWDELGGVTVENRAIRVLMDYGTVVHLELEPKHGQFETVQRELVRVPDSKCMFVRSDHEFRASLPEDRVVIESVLEIPDGDTDAWTDRLFYFDEFAVLTDQSWLYRSVPHETHIREINPGGHEGVIEELNETLDPVRGSAVVPFGGLVSWTTDDTTYDLKWDSLYCSNKEKSASYDLERLKQVTVLFSEDSLRLDWKPVSQESLLRRTIWRVLNPESATPPAHVEIPAGEDGEKILEAFRQLREKLGYEYSVETASD